MNKGTAILIAIAAVIVALMIAGGLSRIQGCKAAGGVFVYNTCFDRAAVIK